MTRWNALPRLHYPHPWRGCSAWRLEADEKGDQQRRPSNSDRSTQSSTLVVLRPHVSNEGGSAHDVENDIVVIGTARYRASAEGTGRTVVTVVALRLAAGAHVNVGATVAIGAAGVEAVAAFAGIDLATIRT